MLQRIIWLYKRCQLLYDEIRKTVPPRVEFVQWIPNDSDSLYLKLTAIKDLKVMDLFTEGNQHIYAWLY